MEEKRLVAGVLAHVDAGKTTLSEAMLYRAGAIRTLGRVDHGNAFLDTDAQEKARGITIFSSQAVLALPGADITLLDTPGHVDFSAETERVLQALDYAVLVVSGTEGIQSHTETLWRLLARWRLPVFVFVNKMDLPGADRAARLAELNRRFGGGFVDFSAGADPAARQEALALCDEPLFAAATGQGAIPDDLLAAAIARRRVFPCWFGAALRLDGVDALLDGLARLTRAPARHEGFGARVFKIGQDAQGARLTYMKITGGALAVKAMVTGRDAAGVWQEKADGIRRYAGARCTPLAEALPGMAVAVTGLTRTFAGQGLGAEPDAPAPALEPVLSCRVLPADPAALPAVLAAFRQLAQEDPQLRLAWNEQLAELHVQLMGEVQTEVLRAVLQSRFGLAVTFGPGSILYKETVTRAGVGIGHYEPLRHYAEVHLLLEPGAPGSGLVLAARCREDALDKNWQKLVLTHLAEKTQRGVLAGMPLTDMKITLLAGRAHPKHTEGGDFRQATYRALRQGLRSLQAAGGTALLEPYVQFRLEVPPEAVGRAMTDLQRLGAAFAPPQAAPADDPAALTLLAGRAPAAVLRDYPAQVTAYTRGRGRISSVPAGYAPCHNAAEVMSALGYDPDRDTDDPADSIFCSHGAGVLVKWNEVPAHAHVADGWQPDADPGAGQDETAAFPARARRAPYRGTLAEDKELLAIFERTYGPVRRAGPDGCGAFRPAEKSSRTAPAAPDRPGGAADRAGPAQNRTDAVRPAVPSPPAPEYLLVDGYNVIFGWEDLAALARQNLDAARRRLTDILCNYRGVSRAEVILVFDAYRVPGGTGSVTRCHNISVVYTKEAETADMYIEKATHRIARENRVRVVTSDGVEQIIVLGNGALRVSARAFRQEVDAAMAALREWLAGSAP